MRKVEKKKKKDMCYELGKLNLETWKTEKQSCTDFHISLGLIHELSQNVLDGFFLVMVM